MAGSNFSAIDTTGTLNPFTMVNNTITTGIITCDTLNATTSNVGTIVDTSVQIGTSGTSGILTIYPSTAAKGALTITAGNSAGDTITHIVNASQSGARTYTIPDAGSASANFVLDSATQTLTNKTLTAPTITGATITLAAGQSGTFVANGTSAVTITNANLTANSTVLYGLKTVGGTPAGKPYEATVTPGTGFTVKAFAGDTSTYNYSIIG